MKLFGISRNAMVAGLVGAGAMGAFLLGPQFPNADANPITLEAPAGAPVSFADLIEQVSPAVVGVRVRTEIQLSDRELTDRERFLEQFGEQFGLIPREEAPQPREGFGQGSGFFISAEGHIVTNNHVVDNAVEILVTTDDGSELEAELVGVDAETDLAVLKVISPGPHPYVDFGPSKQLRRGDWVVAVGSPLGFSGTATAGIVSAVGEPGDIRRSQSYTDYLQIDAAINRGNSGGPTFDMNGRVVGVNTWIASTTGGSIGLGFAIPSELVDQVTTTLINEGRVSRGWLGVTIGNVSDDMAEAVGLPNNRGAIVSTVTEDSPADKSGLERGDIIVKVNGRQVDDATTTTRMVGALAVGSKNKFEIYRDGKRMVIDVTVGDRSKGLGQVTTLASSSSPEPEENESGPLGVSLTPLTDEERERLQLDSSEKGMLITALDADSALFEAGVREGMAILDVNYNKLDSIDVLEEELNEVRSNGRNRLLLAIQDERVGTRFVAIDVDEDE
ncbi:MAG: Do family serine endopeptidase [Hyphomonadaceae bacterium]|nr:Do family serine endopeptidase [Hyphomonadaceae bacterium]